MRRAGAVVRLATTPLAKQAGYAPATVPARMAVAMAMTVSMPAMSPVPAGLDGVRRRRQCAKAEERRGQRAARAVQSSFVHNVFLYRCSGFGASQHKTGGRVFECKIERVASSFQKNSP